MRSSEARLILGFLSEPVHNARRDAQVVRLSPERSGDQVIGLHGPEKEVVAVGNVYTSAKPTRTVAARPMPSGIMKVREGMVMAI